MKWFGMIEHVHFFASGRLISLLGQHIMAFPRDFSVIVLMKSESVISSRIDALLAAKFDVGNFYLDASMIKV